MRDPARPSSRLTTVTPYLPLNDLLFHTNHTVIEDAQMICLARSGSGVGSGPGSSGDLSALVDPEMVSQSLVALTAIRALTEEGPPFDPVGFYLSASNYRLEGLMQRLREEYSGHPTVGRVALLLQVIVRELAHTLKETHEVCMNSHVANI